MLDNIVVGMGEVYLNSFFVNGQDTLVSSNIDEAISTIKSSKKLNIYLMARVKENKTVQINSRENSSNKPTLQVKVNGVEKSYVAIKDNYIQYGAGNYGSNSMLEVCEYGYSSCNETRVYNSKLSLNKIMPYSSYTKRAYIQFDLNDIQPSDSVTDARILLYGKNNTDNSEKEIMIIKNDNSVWAEYSQLFDNTPLNTYSWQGTESIDWREPKGSEEQYIYNLARFYMLRTLISAYGETSNENYAQKAGELINDFITMTSNSTNYFCSLDVAIRTIEWISAYDNMKNASMFNSETFFEFIMCVNKMADFLGDTGLESPPMAHSDGSYHSTHNWGSFETLGLYTAAVYFPEFSKSVQWKTLANQRLLSLSSSMINSDGAYCEASSMYAGYALNNFINLLNFARLNNQSIDENVRQKLLLHADYVINHSYPDYNDIQYGHSDSVNWKSMVMKIGNLLNDYELTNYVSGIGAERYNSRIYNDTKLGILRNADNSIYIGMNAAGGVGGHSNADDLNIVLYALGRPLIIDGGRYTYTRDSNADIAGEWLEKTIAHNTVEINNSSQIRAQSLNEQKPEAYLGKINFFHKSNKIQALSMSTTNNPGFIHKRDLILFNNEYLIVSDYVKGGGIFTTKQLWHTLPDSNLAIETNGIAKTNYANGANIAIKSLDAEPVKESGYYSKSYGVVESSSYIALPKSGTGKQIYDTILIPYKQGDNPAITTKCILDNNNTVAYEIRDSVYCNAREKSEENINFGDYRFNGNIALVSSNYIFAQGASYLNKNDMSIGFQSTYALQTLAGYINGDTLLLECNDENIWNKNNEFSLFTNKIINNVIVNNNNEKFTRNNGVIKLIKSDVAVENDLADIKLGNVENIAFYNLRLPSVGEWGSNYEYQSDNIQVIDSLGTVIRGNDDCIVKITVTAQKGNAIKTKQISILVPGKGQNDLEKVFYDDFNYSDNNSMAGIWNFYSNNEDILKGTVFENGDRYAELMSRQ